MSAVRSLVGGLSAFLLFVILSQPSQAQSCRLALVLALDVSGSVDPVEYAQQVDGLAAALDHPDVRSQILSAADAHVMLTVFEWSSRNHQHVIQPWIALNSAGAVDQAVSRIRSHRKVRAGLKTALGTALSFAASMIGQQPHCWVKTIDVSGDGINNIGPAPSQVYPSRAFDAITVNALVIGDPIGAAATVPVDAKQELLRYFETQVIHGPGSFAMIARGYDDYTDAMRRKLMRELALPIIGMSDH